MKYNEIVKAHFALLEIAKMPLAHKKAYQIFKIRKKIDGEMSFYIEEEKKLIDQYALKDENGNPMITGNNVDFPDPEARRHFEMARNRLLDEECNVEIEPAHLTETDLEGQRVSASAIEALEGIVDMN